MKRIIIILISVFFVLNFQYGKELKQVVLCHPQSSQIKNILIMRELGVFPEKNLELLCLYHEDELTSYGSAKKFVIDEGLNWVRFEKIIGRVSRDNLFKKNAWTEQFKKIFENSNGIIFTGGWDIPASIYGEKNILLSQPLTPYRSYYEISFIYHLIGRGGSFPAFLKKRPNYPILAICLGEQSLNIAAGGTLYQDIPSEVYGISSIEDVVNMDRDKIHRNGYFKALNPQIKALFYHLHRIKLRNSDFFKRTGIDIAKTPFVVSSHHQAAKKIGKGLKIIATSMDGKIVEALNHENFKNVLGVQFHPEIYKLYQKNRFFRKTIRGNRDFNPYTFLKTNNKSMDFHIKIWKWFAKNL